MAAKREGLHGRHYLRLVMPRQVLLSYSGRAIRWSSRLRVLNTADGLSADNSVQSLFGRRHGGHFGRAAPLALPGNDLAVSEQLAAPNTGRFPSRKCRLQARLDQSAGRTDRLGQLDVGDLVGKIEGRKRARPIAACRVLPSDSR